MANLGLSGANNPIYQSSLQMAQESGQMKNAAMSAVFQNAIQMQAKKVGGMMDMYTKLATESGSPEMQAFAFTKLGEIFNTDFSGAADRYKEMATELKDIRKVAADESGIYEPEIGKTLVNNFIAKYGSKPIENVVQEFKKRDEQFNLQKGVLAGEQMGRTSELSSNPEAYNYAMQERIRALSQGGKTGEDIIKEISKPQKQHEGATPFALVTFEAASGLTPEQRGTPQYGEAFKQWHADTYGYKSFVGRDEQGRPIIFNSKGPQGVSTGDTPMGTVKPKTDKFVGEETIKETAMADSLLNGLSNIRELAAKNKQFIGPVEGRWNKIKSNFVNNADFTELNREVESLITMAYGLSGKQITVQEMEMLKNAILPTVTQPDANFTVAIDHAEKWIKRNKTNRGALLKEGGYVVGPKLSGEVDTPPPAGGASTGGKKLDKATAAKIMQEAGGDANKAREIAKSRGYSF